MSLEAVRAFLAAGDALAGEASAREAEETARTEEQRARARELEDDGGLIAYTERIAHRLFGADKARRMHHLAPQGDVYQRAEDALRGHASPIFATMHGAVQHGKTTLAQAWIVRTLRRNPRARLGYVSFSADRAEGKMWTCRELAAGEGIRIHPTFNTKREWRTVEGGIVRAGGILDGSWTGQGFDAILLDDLYAGPKEADSAAHRALIERTFFDVIWTRRAKHTSIIVDMARWGPNDLIGVLIRQGWPYICLPAILDEGTDHERALNPEFQPLAELLATRDGRPATSTSPGMAGVPRRTWASLYQGRPVPDGARVFDPSHLRLYDRLPDGPFFEVLGIDVAYGAKARNDRSAIVGWRRYPSAPRDLFLVESWLGHEPVELFACRVAAAQIRRAGGPRLPLPERAADIDSIWRPVIQPHARARRLLAWWYASGTEAGAAGLLRTYGADVRTVTAGIDKLARAQGGYVDPQVGGYTSTWSEGHVHWPSQEGEHATALRIQHEDFTGSTGDDDDGVDAAVAGHDAAQLVQLSALTAEQERRQREAAAKAMQVRARGVDGGPLRMRW